MTIVMVQDEGRSGGGEAVLTCAFLSQKSASDFCHGREMELDRDEREASSV